MKKYDFRNFFAGTTANWVPCDRPRMNPDFYSFSGSTYWDLGDRVVRWSNHWGPNIRSCCWFFDGRAVSSRHSICAVCSYEDFEPNPDRFVLSWHKKTRPKIRHSRRL